MKFLNIIVILFLHCFRLPCEMKSHHGLLSWNFILGLKSRYKQPLRQSFLRKWLIIFVKGSILYLSLGSECASVVCVIILSLKSFLHNLICYFFLFSIVIQIFVFFNFFDFPWNTYTCTTIGNKILLKSLVISSDLSLHNWGRLC